MIELTAEKVTELLRAAVEDRGTDYVYPKAETGEVRPYRADVETSCYYVHADADGRPKPGCIVGWVLAAAGVPLQDLAECEGEAARAAVQHAVNKQRVMVTMTDPMTCALSKPVQLLDLAQRYQDEGEEWGYAVEQAIKQVLDR